MKLTKYGHACFTVEKDGQVLVVDPGGWSTDFIAPADVVAVVYTHDHFDHLNHEILESIVDKNPSTVTIAHESITSKIEVFETKTVAAGETITVGPFTLAFHGGQHAFVHGNLPQTANLGVFINELLYYPGDSFTLPGQPVDTLALPVGGPWLKLDEAITFLEIVKPRFAFPTHDAMLAESGKASVDTWVAQFAGQAGVDYRRLTDTIDI